MYQQKGEGKPIEQYDHKGKERINNPPVGLVTPELDKDVGKKQYLLAQVVRIVEQYLATGKVYITPPLFNEDELRRRIILTLSMNKIVQHIWGAIRQENTEEITPVLILIR